MNYYILINSLIYFIGWNLLLIPESEVPSLVFGWSLLLFVPLFVISELSRNSKVDKWFYRSFRGHQYDRLLIAIALGTGLFSTAFSFGVSLFKEGDWAVYCLIISTVLNALFVAALQFFLYIRLLKQQKNKER